MATPTLLARQIAQSIGVGSYELDLSMLTGEQIAYNGKMTYVSLDGTSPPRGGWCHVLLLRGATRWVAVISQTPDCDISIVNTIEHIASFLLYFFTLPLLLSLHSPQDEDGKELWQELDFVPANITFVQYLPAGCFSLESAHTRHEYAQMKFSWEEREFAGRGYFQAKKPADARFVMGMWQDATKEDIDNLIKRL